MKVEFINPFVEAAYRVLKQEVGAEIEKGQLSIVESAHTSEEVTVMIGVVGRVQGAVFYGMSEKTAKQMAAKMLGQSTPVFDSMAESAIAELGNVITGLASGGLEKAGYQCRLAPPTVIFGRGVIISTVNIKRLVIPLSTQYGRIQINVALRENGPPLELNAPGSGAGEQVRRL